MYGTRYKWRNRELYQWVRREHIVAIALLDPKGRFELRNNRIRARYGHSIKVDIKYRREYPQKLYHGTSTDKLNSILKKGLKPMKRLYVHMTTNLEEAIDNARRHGKPVILEIDTECLKKKNISPYTGQGKIPI